MSRDKQIEEMYKDVYEAIEHNSVIDITHGGYIGISTDGLTKELYDDGYRRAEDVAREIFEEIEKVFINNHVESFKNYRDEMVYRFNTNLTVAFAELKKKYTEGEG